jgi:hypothetical protein
VQAHARLIAHNIKSPCEQGPWPAARASSASGCTGADWHGCHRAQLAAI